ncbi:RPA-interacting protein A [Trichonephila inaurata madagascariensis]|uniref:RPA-interacting protein A n=1 Tax=Trichonephila inaurata madagascariensis TaxID=2747483 RepID=A0A8X6WL30_9ARAC|nr:RPA-interacting protein A [Trichonephila inaurata madagascariensis]
METSKNTANDRLKEHHTLYKLKTPPWKETFRMRCYQRLKNSRGRLVDKFRGIESCSDETIDVLMREDWKAMSKKNNPLSSIFQNNVNDLDDGEINEFINIMEEIQKEFLEEERKYLEEYAASEARNLNLEIDWLKQDEIICPVCQKNPLHQILSVIFCACGLRIDVQQDGLTLQHLKASLHKGLEDHEQNCLVTPSFSLLHFLNDTNLAITCGVCSFMYIVI